MNKSSPHNDPPASFMRQALSLLAKLWRGELHSVEFTRTSKGIVYQERMPRKSLQSDKK